MSEILFKDKVLLKLQYEKFQARSSTALDNYVHLRHIQNIFVSM